MAVVFDIRAMRDDFKCFERATKQFFINPTRFSELENQLDNAVSSALRNDRKVLWTTDVGSGPIQTRPSGDYRNQGGQKSLSAEVSFSFAGYLPAEDDNRFVIQLGGTAVKLSWSEGEAQTRYHFDIHPDAPGHPLLHIQFDGAVAELPRLHAILTHPLDILEFTLMELFQTKWRESRADTKFISAVRKYPSNQQKRLVALLEDYKSWLESGESALIALLKNPRTPLDLYPA